MPAFIKTPAQERLWEKAKGLAEDAGHKEDWAYVTGIYKKLHGGKVALQSKSADDLESYMYSLTSEHLMETMVQRVAQRYIARDKTANVMTDLTGYSPRLIREAKEDFFKEIVLAARMVPEIKVTKIISPIVNNEMWKRVKTMDSGSIRETFESGNWDTAVTTLKMDVQTSGLRGDPDAPYETEYVTYSVEYPKQITGYVECRIDMNTGIKPIMLAVNQWAMKLRHTVPWAKIPKLKERMVEAISEQDLIQYDKWDMHVLDNVISEAVDEYVSDDLELTAEHDSEFDFDISPQLAIDSIKFDDYPDYEGEPDELSLKLFFTIKASFRME
jgi:hypothetical protein